MAAVGLTEPPPEPDNTGSSQEQRRSSPEELAVIVHTPSAGGVSAYTYSEALSHHLEHGIRTSAAMALLRTGVHSLEEQLIQLRHERDRAMRDLEELREQYHMSDTRCCVLKERIRNGLQFGIIQNILITFGGSVLGVSVPVALEKKLAWSIGGTVLGLILLICGWMPLKRNGEVTR